MDTAPLTPQHRAAAPALAAALRVLLTGLAALIARALLRDPRHAALIVPLWTRLNRAATRFDRLMARVVAGTERPRARAAAARAPRTATPVRFPARHAWLLAALRHEGGHFTQRIEHLLSDPATAALVAAVPQVRSLLRPICHMLGVDHPAIPRRRKPPAPPVRAADDRAADAPRPRPPEPEPTLLPRPPVEICPRLLTRWPWVPHPGMRRA